MNFYEFATLVIYIVSMVVIVKTMYPSDNGRQERYPQPYWPSEGGCVMTLLTWVAVWGLIVAIVFAGIVDGMIWMTGHEVRYVSDLVHDFLRQYPIIAWVLAGLCYHLLVGFPSYPR